MRHFLLFVVAVVTVYPLWGHPLAQEEESNQIVFQNRSGRSALVKLIGPSPHVVAVPNGESRSVSVDPGEYYFVTRYGSSPNQYSYRKSEKFSVSAAPGQVAQVSITLHTVPDGNFTTKPSSAEDFNSVAGEESTAQGDHRAVPSSAPRHQRATAEDDEAYWTEVDKTNPEELESYLKKYPDGEFADLARARLKKLKGGQQELDATEDGTRSGSGGSERMPPIPHLTGTLWCSGDGFAFYFEGAGAVIIKAKPGTGGGGHGVWKQTGKIVHIKATTTGEREAIGDMRWWRYEKGFIPIDPVANQWKGFYYIAFSDYGGRAVNLSEGPCLWQQ